MVSKFITLPRPGPDDSSKDGLVKWMTKLNAMNPFFFLKFQIKDLFPDKHDDWAIAKAYLTFFSSCAKVHPTEGHLSNTKWWMQLVQGQIGLAAGEANIMDYAVIPDPVNQHDKVMPHASNLRVNFVLISIKLQLNRRFLVILNLVDLFHLRTFENSRLDSK
jgi:hypothetical protein